MNGMLTEYYFNVKPRLGRIDRLTRNNRRLNTNLIQRAKIHMQALKFEAI